MKHLELKYLLLVIILLAFSLNINGQTQLPLEPSRTRHITAEDGLSQVSINALLKDNQGFIWIGTQDGLNRFDGQVVQNYRYDPKNGNSLCGNLINTLHQDQKSRIWIGTTNRGVCFFDPNDGNFHVPKVEKKWENILTKGIVKNICEDDIGRKWINTLNFGVYILTDLGENKFDFSTVELPASNQLTTSVYISNDQAKIWIGTENGRVWMGELKQIYDKSVFSEIHFPESLGKINCFIGNSDMTWVGSDNGLWRLSSKGTISHYDLNTAGIKKTRKYSIYDLKFNMAGELWVATGNGLYHLRDRSNDGHYQHSSKYDEKARTPISHNTVYSIMVNEDLLWIGTAKNLNIFDFSSPRFNVLSHGGNSGLSNPIVFSIYESKGDLWVGTAGGLNLFRDNKTYCFKENPADPFSISDDIVRSITPDNQGNLWIGTTKGVSIIDLETFDPKRARFVTIYARPNDLTSLNDDNTRDIMLDQSGNIWITTYGQGICRFTGNIRTNDISFQQFRHDPSISNSISSNYVYCIAQDGRGDYWIGTQDGLDHMGEVSEDFSQYRIVRYKHDAENNMSISDNSIHVIHFDEDNVMWVGTRYGLNKFNSETKSFQSFSSSDGLPNNVIYSIQPDNRGNLWLGTNNGLVCFNKSDHSLKNYFDTDGIANNEFDINANFRNQKGIIHMGGHFGCHLFRPRLCFKKPAKYSSIDYRAIASRN